MPNVIRRIEQFEQEHNALAIAIWSVVFVVSMFSALFAVLP